MPCAWIFFPDFVLTLEADNYGLKPPIFKNYHIFGKLRTSAFTGYHPGSFQLLEYQMCCGGGLIWYSREIGLCPPCTWDTPHIWGDPISAVEKRRKAGGSLPPFFHHWNGIISHFSGGNASAALPPFFHCWIGITPYMGCIPCARWAETNFPRVSD